MKRIPPLITAIILLSVLTFTFFGGCAKDETVEDKSVITLKVMSWEDYIDDEECVDEENDIYEGSVIEEFEKYCKETLHKNVKVEYSTVGTNEEMYTKINLNKESYDLVCPSEYMIQKMIGENMLEKLDHTKTAVYDNNVSRYISDLFKKIPVTKADGSTEYLYDYAACYMWGTMGFVYNPEFVEEAEVTDWSAVWNKNFKNKCTIKDSVRDSYVLALGYVYHDVLMEYKNKLDAGEITANEYNKQLTDIFNNVSDEAVEKTGVALKELAPTLYGYEVDSGKKDMAAGKIWINFAWSGDAVYAMDYAEDPEMVGEKTAELNYIVPEEGSNIFFDGWVMPKGSKVEIAQEYINFISDPHYAQRNMDYIGYTTSIATKDIFENVIDNYGYANAVQIGDSYFAADENDERILDEDGQPVEVYPVDLSYLFKKGDDDDTDYTVYTDTLGRQFSAQYPDYETVTRCTVMRHFTDEEVVKLNKMWEQSKPTAWQGVFIASVIVIAAFVLAYVIYRLVSSDLFRPKPKKGYHIVDEQK